MFDGLRAGASGYMLKDASAEGLVAAIHAASRGESPLQPRCGEAGRGCARNLRGNHVDGTPQGAEMADLTEREREILRYYLRGSTTADRRALFITEGTVKTLPNILNKLALRDRTQAVLWAREHGLM
jgi:DNA-binding NarL/FixJ family response regulator